MPTNFLVDLEAVTAESATRRKPKRIIHGIRRREIRKLLRIALTVQRQDVRERARAEALNYNAVVFARITSLDNAMKAIIARCTELLNARA